MQKRILSMLLALCLLAGILPPQAIAAGETSPFTDVKPSDWYYEGVEYVQEHNLMNGTGGGKFSPDQQMSRGMVATVLHRLAGTPASASVAEFSDVPEGQWYSQAIAWAAEQQIVSGYGDNLFGVHDPITRQQLTAILYRYAQKTGADLSKTADLSAFTDRDQVSEYALAPMQWAVGSGLLTGTSATTLSPNGTASRGQIATILARFGKNPPEKSQFTVTFHLNYGENPVYQTQTVESGKTASKPADPARSGHAFAGWHTKKEGGAPYDFAAPVTGDLVLYALWTQAASGGLGGGGGFGGSGSGSGSGSSGDSTSPYLYSITGVTAAEGKALVTVNTDKACTLQVRVLDDEGKTVLDTATAPTAAQLELENIQVPLNKALPEYFRLEASLLDENGKELCDKFLCVNYTSAYAAFDAATVDDFDGQIVLNFDDQPDENFGVLPKGAIQAQALPAGRATGDQMTLDNTDHRLDQTKVGDIIAVYNAQGEVEDLIKVGKITLSENQALIQPDPDATLEDFYDLLKVDITIDADESMVDMSGADEGVTLVPSEEGPQGRATITQTVKFGVDRDIGEFFNLNLEGSYISSITLEIEWEPHLFKDSYFYFGQKSVSDWEYTGEISAKIDSNEAKTKKEEAELNLGKLKLPTGIPGVQSELVLSLPISLTLEGNITVSQTIHDERTFSYSSESGTHSGSKQETTDSLDFAAKVTVEIAFKVSLSCQLWNEIIKASCSFSLGIEITGALSKNLAQKPEVEEIHACDVCIDGNAETKVSVDISLTAKPVKTKLTLASYAISLTLTSKDFYFSHQNSLDSPLGGRPTFGWDQCPNRKYRTEFAVQDSSGQAVPDAQLTVSKGTQPIPDAAPGKALYLYNGDYTATAQAGSRQGSKDFKVNGKAQTVTVQLGKEADEPDNPDLTKLATPTNLTWGKNYDEDIPGSAQWDRDSYANRYQFKIYEAGSDREISKSTHNMKNVSIREKFCSYSVHIDDIEKNGSGNYYFTVQSLGDGETTADSDIARSENWTYVTPNEQLFPVSMPQLNADQTRFTWNKASDESRVYGYNLQIWYSASKDGADKKSLGSTYMPEPRGEYVVEHISHFNRFDPQEGRYYFIRVKAVPKDMTQYRSSEWSEFSEPYHYVP